jgi:hypothetical protein
MKPETSNNDEQLSEKLGRLAFAWCKVATPCLLLGRFALPVAAFLSSSLFIWAYVQGKKDTKCALKYPLFAAGFWIIILSIWLFLEFSPGQTPAWLSWLHR